MWVNSCERAICVWIYFCFEGEAPLRYSFYFWEPLFLLLLLPLSSFSFLLLAALLLLLHCSSLPLLSLFLLLVPTETQSQEMKTSFYLLLLLHDRLKPHLRLSPFLLLLCIVPEIFGYNSLLTLFKFYNINSLSGKAILIFLAFYPAVIICMNYIIPVFYLRTVQRPFFTFFILFLTHFTIFAFTVIPLIHFLQSVPQIIQKIKNVFNKKLFLNGYLITSQQWIGQHSVMEHKAHSTVSTWGTSSSALISSSALSILSQDLRMRVNLKLIKERNLNLKWESAYINIM